MVHTKVLSDLLKDVQVAQVDLKTIPVLREKVLINFLSNRKLKWLLYSVTVFWILFHFLGFKLLTNDCTVTFPTIIADTFRPAIDCSFCRSVDSFDIRNNLQPSEFETYYAYSRRPLKITDATLNWTAPDVFDYWYFKEIYDEFEANNENFDCQFFPYKSGFSSIFEAFRMPGSRVNQETGEKPWYFGWSNCNNEIAKEFRKHYSKPYFLPELSETAKTDWIFIGVPGMGAHLHVSSMEYIINQ